MRVYKFGGASVKDAWGVKNLGNIVSKAEGPLIVVVSALGKTTNSLENVLLSILKGDDAYSSEFQNIADYHLTLAESLFGREKANSLLLPLINEIINIMPGLMGKDYDLAYDQLVSQGEILSTKIVDRWLNNEGINSEWIDIRKLLITDSKFRDAGVDWEETKNRMKPVLLADKEKVFVTQGFIGGTLKGETTTLGREGSDYTAAIVSNICDASELTIWKDVPGVLNADPLWMQDTRKLQNISYKEAVEMSFSGAKIIHPKTIKPLHNKSIPLYVKSFIDPQERGTIVSVNESIDQDVPVYVRKEAQVLLSLIPRDFSFAIGDNLGKIFQVFNSCAIKANLVQASAVSVAVCVDEEKRKIDRLNSLLHGDYKMLVNEGVELLTLRHYDESAINKLTGGKEILLEQRTRKSIRFVVKKD